jgi:hypothetical protein
MIINAFLMSKNIGYESSLTFEPWFISYFMALNHNVEFSPLIACENNLDHLYVQCQHQILGGIQHNH